MPEPVAHDVCYLVVSRRSVADEARRAYHPAHLNWLHTEHAAGRLLMSGPTVDRECGLYLVAAPDHETATAIAASDPYHEHGVRAFEVFDWEVQRTAEGVRLRRES